ncbi:MAG: hypothetical protein IKO99_02330 [Bacteroidales bacterium]|nr:hypothetical protein [Bacteroidales bacterium]
MFNPKSSKDRQNYGDIIAPEPEYVLVNAVTTTYSLDLETLTSCTLSLSLGEATDSQLVRNPINLLYAIHRAAGRIIVFCESSQIKLPKKKSKLSGLLENSIVPVSLPETKNGFPSFHPKTWILKYENIETKEVKFRFIVLSRNLTFDRSWDVSVCLDGKISEDEDPKTRPLIDFLSFLKQQINENGSAKSEIIGGFINELKKVSFSTEDTDFTDFEILPLGIGTADIKNDHLFAGKFKDLAVMSPFVSKSVINKFISLRQTYSTLTLITRKEELEKIKSLEYWRLNAYCLKDEIVNGENFLPDYENSEEIDNIPPSDIHAKIYVKTTTKDKTYVYLGSMNASQNGVDRNVEMLLKLRNDNFTPSAFIEDLGLNEENSLFEKMALYNIKTEKEEVKDDNETVLKQILRLPISAEIHQANGCYNAVLRFKDFVTTNYAVKIAPFMLENFKKDLSETIVFDGLKLEQLSQLYIIEIGDLQRVIMIPTLGMPDDREKMIIKSVISNRRKLSEYIAFILGDDKLQTFAENEEDMEMLETEFSDNISSKNQNIMFPVYEKMLKAAYTNPERLKEIDDIIKLIDDEEIINQEFKDMYTTFKSTLKF